MLERAIRTIVKDQEILTAPAKTSASDAARLMKQQSQSGTDHIFFQRKNAVCPRFTD